MITIRYKLLFAIALLIATSCAKEDVIVENTTITPDLSDPIMQKISNQTWYKDPRLSAGGARLVWESKENVPSPSEAAASLLYMAAFQNITLNRDGSSSMMFRPPFFPNVFIHNRGNWQVTKTEENAIILNTKTPVSNTTAKIKVLNMEAQEQVTMLTVSMDFGNRMMEFDFTNSSYQSSPVETSAEDFRWVDQQAISTAPLDVDDFVGTWASPNYGEIAEIGNYREEDIIRVTHIEDLLLSTPTVLSGQAFDLRADGTATIAYKVFERTFGGEFLKILPEGKILASNATWEVKGNKIFVRTDEAFFYSVGELLFHLPVYGEHLTQVGVVEGLPIRVQEQRYYAIELIEKRDEGFWSRITTNDAIFYLFLSKVPFDVNETINIKTAF